MVADPMFLEERVRKFIPPQLVCQFCKGAAEFREARNSGERYPYCKQCGPLSCADCETRLAHREPSDFGRKLGARMRKYCPACEDDDTNMSAIEYDQHVNDEPIVLGRTTEKTLRKQRSRRNLRKQPVPITTWSKHRQVLWARDPLTGTVTTIPAIVERSMEAHILTDSWSHHYADRSIEFSYHGLIVTTYVDASRPTRHDALAGRLEARYDARRKRFTIERDSNASLLPIDEFEQEINLRLRKLIPRESRTSSYGDRCHTAAVESIDTIDEHENAWVAKRRYGWNLRTERRHAQHRIAHMVQEAQQRDEALRTKPNRVFNDQRIGHYGYTRSKSTHRVDCPEHTKSARPIAKATHIRSLRKASERRREDATRVTDNGPIFNELLLRLKYSTAGEMFEESLLRRYERALAHTTELMYTNLFKLEQLDVLRTTAVIIRDDVFGSMRWMEDGERELVQRWRTRQHERLSALFPSIKREELYPEEDL